jgi:hypothetical protein
VSRVLFLGLIIGCGGGDEAGKSGSSSAPAADEGVGIVGDGLANPYPNMQLVSDGRLVMDASWFPAPDTPLDLQRFYWRTGFSVAQTSVLAMEGMDPNALPDWRNPSPGEGGVLLFDRTDGVFLPVFAELDAYPDLEAPALIVRPLTRLSEGHQVAVVVSTDVVARPERFDALVSGTPPSSLTDVAPHYRELLDELETAGVDSGQVALAWDFPVGDGTTPLRSALDQLEMDGAYVLDRSRDLDLGDIVAPMTWRALDGRFTTHDFLVDDQLLDFDESGGVKPVGWTEAELYVHVPTSVADADAESVPVMIFGHGIFSEPALYLDENDDPSGLLQLAEEGGFIVVATTWRGLTWNDRVGAIEAAQDFGKMAVIGDRLLQSQLNLASLVHLVEEGTLLDDPQLKGRKGQRLAMRGAPYYYGISAGSIEGAVALASQDRPFRAAAFHVGGSMWSTMLERSSNWIAFELFMLQAMPDAVDRQRLYSLSQLYWDPVDPLSWVPDLTPDDMLYQVSMGDEQVPNMTSEVFARSLGLQVLSPSSTQPYGLQTVAAPLPAGSGAYVQFDPERVHPPDGNRPAEVNGAHHAPRLWDGQRRQVIDYLTPGSEGQVEHHCGDDVCSESNPG